MLRPLERLRRLWLRIPRQVLFMHKLDSVSVTRAAMASVHESHPLLIFLCFGHAQVSARAVLGKGSWTRACVLSAQGKPQLWGHASRGLLRPVAPQSRDQHSGLDSSKWGLLAAGTPCISIGCGTWPQLECQCLRSTWAVKGLS